MPRVLFLDCKEIRTLVMELRLVQLPQLGLAELGFPTCPLSPLPLSGGLCPGPLLPLIALPAEAGCRVSRMAVSQSPARTRQGQPGRWVSGQSIHSGADLVEKQECSPTTLEILQPAWKLPQPLLMALS